MRSGLFREVLESATAATDEVREDLALPLIERLVDLRERRERGVADGVVRRVEVRERFAHVLDLEVVAAERFGDLLCTLRLLLRRLLERRAQLLQRLGDHLLLARRSAETFEEPAQEDGA